jgi:nucleotide-binding universal stress UspA family protein
MNTIVAAIDATAAARPVLETALRLGRTMTADVEAVYVAEGPSLTPESVAERMSVKVRRLEGRAGDALIEAIEASTVTMALIGARATTGGRLPVGRTALQVLERTTKPTVVVPPEAVSSAELRRFLVPLEGTETSTRAVTQRLAALTGSDIELVVLHVFTDLTLPRMLDRPDYDYDLLGKEFLLSHLPQAKSVELRTGPVGPRVVEVCRQRGADLVVLSWSQVTTANRARVVQDVLGSSPVPVMLIPPIRPEDQE